MFMTLWLLMTSKRPHTRLMPRRHARQPRRRRQHGAIAAVSASFLDDYIQKKALYFFSPILVLPLQRKIVIAKTTSINKNNNRKKKYVRPTTAIIMTDKILVWPAPHTDLDFDEDGEDNAVSYSSRGSAVNNVWDEAGSYDGDILMK